MTGHTPWSEIKHKRGMTLNALINTASDRTMVHRSTVDELGPDGIWRDSCPLPFFFAFGRCKCECGKRFWSTAKYRAHWRAENEKLMWWRFL